MVRLLLSYSPAVLTKLGVDMDYSEFLQKKELIHYGDGLDLTITHDRFLEYQDAIVNWALKKGKSAIFADCGLGKSFMAMAILDGISKHINKPALLITPLQILNQFIKEEAPKFGYQINNLRENPVAQGINII